MTYLRDEKYLHDIAHMAYPDLPFFVFGHSWGSMLGRAYAALYGDDLAGLMLCGLVSQFKGCEIEYNDPAIRAAVAADPYQPSGEWFGKVFLGMTDRIENPNGPAEFLTIDEGLCVQIMHLGAFDDEPATVALMDAYLERNGYANDLNKERLHHEIYLSDARKVAPEKRKTVIRHPIKKI